MIQDLISPVSVPTYTKASRMPPKCNSPIPEDSRELEVNISNT
jgi:hypothetical protein